MAYLFISKHILVFTAWIKKNISFGLSLNTWQEKIFNWTSALNELVHFLDSESQSQPWKKIIHDSVSISICYRVGGNLKNLSLVEKFCCCQQYIQGWGKTKNRQKRAKNGQFLRKKCNFQPQFMTSIHDLEVILAFFHELEWSQSQTFFGHRILSNLSL